MILSDTEVIAYMSNIRAPASLRQSFAMIAQGLQGELETYLRYSIEPGQAAVTEPSWVDSRDGRLHTWTWPIASVSAVLGSDATPATYVLGLDGTLRIPGDVFDVSGYTVTYVPGLPPSVMAQAKLALCRVVAREITPMHDDQRTRQGGPNTRQAAPVPLGWQPAELRRFSYWRRRSDSVYSAPQPWLPGVGPSYGDYSTMGIGQTVESVVGFPGMAEGDATVESP